MCDYDGEGPTFYRRVVRVAKKDHWCCACQERIPLGHRYRLTAGMWDGQIDKYKHCARCVAMLTEICAAAKPGESVLLTLDCGTTWGDAFEIAAPDHLAFLTPDEAQTLLAETAA